MLVICICNNERKISIIDYDDYDLKQKKQREQAKWKTKRWHLKQETCGDYF